jgi:hypothetical protein
VTAKPKTAKTKTAKPKRAGTRRYDPTAKIAWLDKENPFKEGSGAHARTEFVRKASGSTVEAFEKRATGATPFKDRVPSSTLRTLQKLKLAGVG